MSGISSKRQLEHMTPETVYTVPPGKVATVTLNLCNFTDNARRAYVAINDSAPHTHANFLEHGTVIPPHDVLERTGLVLTAGESLRAWVDGNGIAARAHGFEEEA